MIIKMNKIFIFALLLLLASSNNPFCSTLEKLTNDQLWNIVRLDDFERIFILIAGSLSLVGLLLALLSWIIYPSFSTPSDLMFALMIFEFVENAALLSSASYFTIHSEGQIPQDFQPACTSIGTFYILGNIGALVYNILFCSVLSYSITKTLKGTLLSRFRYHFLALSTIALATIAISTSNNIGTGFNGICGYRISNKESIARFIVELIISLICLYSMYSFRANIPQNEYFRKESIFGYYYYYMGIFSFIQIGITISYMISSISCRTGSSITSDIVRISIIFSVCFSILLSFSQIFIRFSHPIVKIKIKQEICCKKNKDISSDDYFSLDEDIWLGSLLQSIKGSQILSFITGILIGYTSHRNKVPRLLTPYHFNRSYIVNLNENITDQYIMKKVDYRASVIVKQKLDGLRTLDYEVKIYAAEVFTKMLIHETLQVLEAFDIGKNIGVVKKSSYTNGGKSGEFFFGTFDHSFVFKTVKEEEAQIYLQKLSQFYDYFEKNPNSLIVKILGVYRFCRKDIEEKPIYIILMKNVSPIDKAYFQRVYDIKGSEFNRSTLQEKKVKKDALSKVTLKDVDFKNLQGRVTISSKESEFIRKIIRKDLDFLSRMGVMDYSLLIIKRKGPAQKGNVISEMVSKQNPEILYNIGIIDYLQSWNLKRKAERAFKTLLTEKQVTATSPQEYSKRLTDFIDEIL